MINLIKDSLPLKEYQSLIDKIPIGIGITDDDGNILISNKTLVETFGYPKELLHELGVRALYADIKDRELLREKLQKEHGVRDYELLLKTKDGNEFIALLNIDMEEINRKKIYYTAIQDITRQKNAEIQLKESEERYRTLYKNIPVPTYTWQKKDDDLVLIDYNDAGKVITHDKVRDVLGLNAKYVYADRMNVANDMLRCLNEQITFSKETPYFIKVIAEMKYFNIKYAFTPPDLVLVHTEDITEKKEAELRLKESEKRYREAYTRAEFYKDLFAHDISNLLQGILSSSQFIESLLKESEVLKKVKIPLKLIKEQIYRGSNLVKNIRKLSQIEEEKIILRKIEIIKILKELIEYFKNQYPNLSIKFNLEPNMDEIFIYGNELISDVFENIIINAINHNNNQNIEIDIKISTIKDNNSNKIQIEFTDNGIGIDENRKRIIFQRANKGKMKGMGLGLSLIKKIIEMYDGKIWVENRIQDDHSKGSKFLILIPEII